MNDTLTPRELLEELWILYFTVIRAILLAITAAIHSVVLVISTFGQHVCAGTEWLYLWVVDWRPAKPRIFETE